MWQKLYSGRLEVAEEQKLQRSVRLAQIQRVLFENPRGFTTRDLAGLFNVSQRTIQRDLLSLHDMNVPVTQEGRRYSILPSYILPPITFSLQEAMAIFLSSRLILRQTDEKNPHIEAALKKLANALPPRIAQRLHQSITAIATKSTNPYYLTVFEQVAIAWAAQRRLRIKYQSLQSTQPKEWLVDPYFVEMTGVGYSTYVIGYARREEKEGLTTFKLDRIREVELLDDTFEIPADLNLEELLTSSWGVIWSETVTEVKLKFSPQVVRRVKESIWHPSQQIEDLPDGSCIVTMEVPSTLEMVPWIRGWGPDVEVLTPEFLRREFENWSLRLYQMYHGVASDG